MTKIEAAAISDRNSRQVAIEVTGLCPQNVRRRSNYTLKVPYYRLSQTIQSLSRKGDRILSVTLLSPTIPETQKQSSSVVVEPSTTPKEINFDRQEKELVPLPRDSETATVTTITKSTTTRTTSRNKSKGRRRNSIRRTTSKIGRKNQRIRQRKTRLKRKLFLLG